MKQRIITGAFMTVFVTPFIIFGSYPMAIFILILMSCGIIELLKCRKLPIYFYVMCFISSFLLIFDVPLYIFEEYSFSYLEGILPNYKINVLWLILFLILVFISGIFDKNIDVGDVFYAFTSITLLSLGLKGLLYLRSIGGVDNALKGMWIVAYLLIVTCCTDIFAYFGGISCYKILGSEKVHKLNERVSPKKTIEGTIIGTIFGTVLGFIFAIFVLKDMAWYYYLLLSFILSLVGQIGDLTMSLIKRHYQIKDFSNLLPGHGGVLDRIDSLLLNSMVAAIFMSIVLFMI